MVDFKTPNKQTKNPKQEKKLFPSLQKVKSNSEHPTALHSPKPRCKFGYQASSTSQLPGEVPHSGAVFRAVEYSKRKTQKVGCASQSLVLAQTCELRVSCTGMTLLHRPKQLFLVSCIIGNWPRERVPLAKPWLVERKAHCETACLKEIRSISVLSFLEINTIFSSEKNPNIFLGFNTCTWYECVYSAQCTKGCPISMTDYFFLD